MVAAASTSHSRVSPRRAVVPGRTGGNERRVRGHEVGSGAGVEQQGGLGAPRPLLEPDHELARAGGRAPVDLPQVVAVAVLADADVVLTVDGDRPSGALAASALSARGTSRAERQHPGDDEQHGAVGADGVALDEPERIHQAQPQRTEDVPAAASPVQAVPEGRRLAGGQPVDDEPR